MHISIALALAVKEDMERPSMESNQVGHLRPATGVTPLPVKEIVGSNQHIIPATQRFSRYFNTTHLFRAYSDSDDLYFGDYKDDFDQKYLPFLDRCNQAKIYSDEDRLLVFPIMLTHHAKIYYF